MPLPCDKAFPVEKFVYLERSIGKGAAGQEEGDGCSSFTRPMLIEPQGKDEAEKAKNFELLKAELEQSLAQRKA